MNLREIVEADLATTLEDYVHGFGLPIELTSPDGEVQTQSANDPDLLLSGQVLYSTIEENPETGERVVVLKPVVTLRISSLERVPLPGEAWAIRIPEKPEVDADKETYLEIDLAVEINRSIGYIKLFLTKPKQSA